MVASGVSGISTGGVVGMSEDGTSGTAIGGLIVSGDRTGSEGIIVEPGLGVGGTSTGVTGVTGVVGVMGIFEIGGASTGGDAGAVAGGVTPAGSDSGGVIPGSASPSEVAGDPAGAGAGGVGSSVKLAPVVEGSSAPVFLKTPISKMSSLVSSSLHPGMMIQTMRMMVAMTTRDSKAVKPLGCFRW